MNDFGPTLFSMFMFGVGLVCLIWPLKVQQYALRSTSIARFNPFYNWMKTPAYLLLMRLCGILALAMAVLVLYGSIR